MHEYTFDIKLWGTCRIKAPTAADARQIMLNTCDLLTIDIKTDNFQLFEVSIEDEGGASELIEIDGEAI